MRTLDAWLGLSSKKQKVEKVVILEEDESMNNPSVLVSSTSQTTPSSSSVASSEELSSIETDSRSNENRFAETRLSEEIPSAPSSSGGEITSDERQEEDADAAAYLRAREARLKRNRQVLADLGLTETPSNETKKSNLSKRPASGKRGDKPPISVVATAQVDMFEEPIRRSKRLTRSTATPGVETAVQTAEEVHVEPDVLVSDSGFPRYFCESFVQSEDNAEKSGKLRSVVELEDPSAKQSYSLSFHPKSDQIIACGGQNGRASLFDGSSSQDNENLLVFSWKAGAGWLSSLRFLNASHLLVSSNDKCMTLWNLEKRIEGGSASTTTNEPFRVKLFRNVHDSGIFDMDSLSESYRAISAGKDGKLICSRILPQGEISTTQVIADAHEGRIVRTVRFATFNSSVFASGGDDGLCKVWDDRLSESSKCVAEFATGWDQVNIVRVHPDEGFSKILSASRANEIKIFDLRKPENDATSLIGHFATTRKLCQKIYQPCFFRNGKYVVTGGEENSRSLSSFRMDDLPALECKASLEWDPLALTTNGAGDKLAATHGSCVSVFV